ncbi:MAG: WhiB family transcriptional regulator [Actinomycetota bacterium]|nr:WhiB family transcriptional regulator [Actinomycetota bacterium]
MTPHEQAVHALLTGSWGAQSILPKRPAWMADSACLEHPEVQFIPSNTRTEERSVEARAICAGCLCRAECAAYALADPDLLGIWGGTTTAGRRVMRKRAA